MATLMTSNTNAKPSMRTSTSSGRDTPSATVPSYSPSVPLSVYRELAAELQAAESVVDSLTTQNQNLAKQNQQLRQEVEKAAQTVLHLQQHLQQIVDSPEAINWTHAPRPTVEIRTEPTHPTSGPRPLPRSRPPAPVQSSVESPYLPTREAESVFPEQLYTEHEQGRYRRRPHPESTSEINGWWLALAILVIVITAFGAGYLVVRPLLQGR